MTYAEQEVVARVGGLSVRRLRLWVRRGWVQPARAGRGWTFSELDVARVRLIRELHEDLMVDADTVPVVLSLMDQVYGLRRELRCLAQAVAEQPEEVRSGILEAVRRGRGG